MKHLPNIITCLNLFSGCLACVMASRGAYADAFIFIAIASVFDFLDGFAARLLKAYSNIGKELDSLADLISFGLAPGFLVFTFLQQTVGFLPMLSNLSFIAFLIPVFSALRLAKFNIDTRQTTSFRGLPTPADALFWAALTSVSYRYIPGNEMVFTIAVVGVLFLFCILMISDIPMFSMKFKNYGWKGNELRYALIIITVLSVVLFKLLGISLIICVYILMSLLFTKRST